MSSTIIDETVILRYLLDDDEVLSPRAAEARSRSTDSTDRKSVV